MVKFITSDEEAFFDELENQPKLKRRFRRDIITVCPLCFSPSKITNADIFTVIYACTDEKCNWEGTIPIEVSKEDYAKFKQKQDNK